MLLAGTYEIERDIGKGAFGYVYLANDRRLDRRVAIKFSSDSSHWEEFQREGRSLAQVTDRTHVVAVHTVGEHDGEPFLVMEYLLGENLEDVVKNAGLPEISKACEYIRQAASGLDAAHAKNVLHGDIRTSNLLLTGRDPGVVKIVDFGMAWVTVPERNQSSPPDPAPAGSMYYMAPEMFQKGVRPNKQSDLYSLGCVFYELLSGQPPFTGSRQEVVDGHLTRQPDAVESKRPEVPADVSDIVHRLLAKERSQRFRSAAELVEALDRFLNPGTRISSWSTRRLAAAVVVLIALAAISGFAHNWRNWLAPRASSVGEEQTSSSQGGRRANEPFVAHDAQDGAIVSRNSKRPIESESLQAQLSVPDVAASAPQSLSGLRVRFDVLVSSAPGGPKDQIPLDQPGALPVRTGERLHLHAQLSHPAHIYLVWFGAEGKPTLLYPWNEIDGNKDSDDKASLKAIQSIHSPPALNRGWEVGGAEGQELIALLVAGKPLDDEAHLRKLLGELTPRPLGVARGARWLEVVGGEIRLDRGPIKSSELDDPDLKLLEFLRSRFEVIQLVRFPHVAESEHD
jgi:serine/threonine protein kinase